MSAIEAREEIIDALRRELVGPDPRGNELLIGSGIHITNEADAYLPHVVAGTKSEILRDKPTLRYGAAVIYPDDQMDLGAGMHGDSEESEVDLESDLIISAEEDELEPGKQIREYGDDDPLDMEVDSSGKLKQSSLGLSFFAELKPRDVVRITLDAGRYEQVEASVATKMGMRNQKWWIRHQVLEVFDVQVNEAKNRVRGETLDFSRSVAPLSLRAVLRVRPPSPAWPASTNGYICTASIINISSGAVEDSISLFQTSIKVEIVRDGLVQQLISPYPEREESVILQNDPEARSISLLYRNNPTFAIGHGCSATWVRPADGIESRLRSEIRGEFLPVVEVPSMTPLISDGQNNLLSVPMGPLAGLDPEDDGIGSLHRLADAYQSWISDKETEANEFIGIHSTAALDHLRLCRLALEQMRQGIELLSNDGQILRAFQLANKAVLNQQLATPANVRKAEIDKNNVYRVEPLPAVTDWRTAVGKGSWRPFQIGFLLSNLASTVFEDDPRRENVELIFFPTGGGKTEAYQGLLAFNLFYQRIIGSDQKTSTLMRYTLRLLTAQQFQRALGLVAWMEKIREEEGIEGERFSLGIWVGSSLTPQTREDALKSFAQLQRAKRENVENLFLILKCPMCSAQMGLIKSHVAKKPLQLMGYQKSKTVEYICPDSNCYYNRRKIPAYVIDEDIYDVCPSLIIGTVDKFAQLPFKEDIRSLFGIGDDGKRAWSPPNLIIQDELHLISGPLGSVVGLYEGLIEELCTKEVNGEKIRPKIVSSTATIRRYEEQALKLFGRERVTLFPPHGLEASDSFFARYSKDSDGNLLPGKKYVGVYAPGLKSLQTIQIRTMASLLQASHDLPESEQDPWHTLLIFLNRIADVGTTKSLTQGFVRDYLKLAISRAGRQFSDIRRIRIVEELTSRLKNTDIPFAIEKLEREYGDPGVVDVCLASSIIEVGVDIQRLSLMQVVGQPKTTSQYIQVTGRVGRNPEKRPGLIVTIHPHTRPRDRSHFERFTAFHNRLYAQVEPISMTPFSDPVLRRALHAVLVGYVRQFGPFGLDPSPVPDDLIQEARKMVAERMARTSPDPDEVASFNTWFTRRNIEWAKWQRVEWLKSRGQGSLPLMYRGGSYIEPEHVGITWEVPQSMREVDAKSEAKISSAYIREHAALVIDGLEREENQND